MKIAIPSKARVTSLFTLDLLKGYPKEDIFIFVEPQDYDHYIRIHGEKATIINIEKNDNGIAYVRNYILGYFSDEEIVWLIDDDIKCLHSRFKYNQEKDYWHLDVQDKPERVLSILKECYLDFKINYSENYLQYGISFRGTNVFYKGTMKENERVWAVCMIRPKIMSQFQYDENLSTFEDYEIIARYYRRGYSNVVNYMYAFSPVPFSKNKGGLEKVYEKEENTKKLCDYLVEKHGKDYVRVKYKEKIKLWQPTFVWKKFKE